MNNVTASATSGSTLNVGVGNDNSSSPVMSNITATATGGIDSYGIYNRALSAPNISNIIAKAHDATRYNAGVWNSSSGLTVIMNLQAECLGGTYCYGVRLNSSSAEISTALISAYTTGSYSNGVFNAGSSISIRNARIIAEGTANVKGVYNYSPTGSSIKIHSSSITGQYSLQNIDDTSTERMVGNSMLSGGIIGNNFTCIGVYDSSFEPLDNTCH
jgi:hypothetical protein